MKRAAWLLSAALFPVAAASVQTSRQMTAFTAAAAIARIQPTPGHLRAGAEVSAAGGAAFAAAAHAGRTGGAAAKRGRR